MSYDDRPDYEATLAWTCNNINLGPEKLWSKLIDYPSIQFGVEMAFRSLESENPFLLHSSKFTKGNDSIAINGLVWMGDEQFMQDQIEEKLENGFTCIKMKVGAIDFDEELKLLSHIRKHYSKDRITLRVDANGGFTFDQAKEHLQRLSDLHIHSIEQPIATKQWQRMAELCSNTPVPIALDEELIGVTALSEKQDVLATIKPQYIILKPSFIGGYKGSEEWINLAEKHSIGWWVTSALESDVGLNAIAQWTYGLNAKGPQGLGTGSLYTNNIPSPLEVENGKIKINPDLEWDFKIN